MISLQAVTIAVLAVAGMAKAAVVPAAKFGQLRVINSPMALCLASTKRINGNPVTVESCGALADQFRNWVSLVGTSGRAAPIELVDGFCLDVTDGNFASGTKLQIYKCSAGNPNQQFIIHNDMTISVAGTNQCVDLTDGVKVPGQPVQIYACSPGNQNQKWNPVGFNTVPSVLPNEAVRFRISNSNGCMKAKTSAPGSPVVYGSCASNSPLQIYHVLNGGGVNSLATSPINLQVDQQLCLDVTDGIDEDGTPLQMYTCSTGNPNQRFRVTADNQIQWVGKNKCVDLTDGIKAPGNQLQIYTCDPTASNPNQLFIPQPV